MHVLNIYITVGPHGQRDYRCGEEDCLPDGPPLRAHTRGQGNQAGAYCLR